MKLLIVESPTKATKISGFLGADWRVEASRGHLRDLPDSALGIDVKADFAMDYRLLPDQRGTLARLKKLAAEAEAVYLATDPDREGEGIAWHLAELLRTTIQPSRLYRVTFNAITPSAVQAGIAAPRRVDQALVDAQQARRTLDRLVGYLASPLACQSLAGPYSAGRVQSACLRLVVEREREIAAFKAVPYWTLDAELEADGVQFTAVLSAVREFRTLHWPQAVTEQLAEALRDATFTVADYRTAETARRPAPPFTTSTLQQAASKALHLTPERTMQLAQTLYERGLITYMRTEGIFVTPEAQQAARAFIAREFEPSYLPAMPQVYVSSRNAGREAHEAIRPTDIEMRPETLPEGVGRALYALIWKRFLASQMGDARYSGQMALIHASKNAQSRQPVQFIAKGRTLRFDGFLKVYEEPLDEGENQPSDAALPALIVGSTLKLHSLTPTAHTPEPPRRFTEARLVAALEAKGVGRPSTYASMVRLIQDKGYVKAEKRLLVPTESGIKLNDFLAASFPGFFEADFTARLEGQLDEIAAGKAERLTVLNAFWKDFAACYEPLAAPFAKSAPAKPTLPKIVGVCPKCGGNLVERRGKGGIFAGCVNFPKCNGRAGIVALTTSRKGA